MTKIVLITGASSGIGKATAAVLAEAGYCVFGTSRNATQSDINGVEMIRLDVTSDASVAEAVDYVIQKVGRIDVLVNNAGVELYGAVEETTIDEYYRLLETNFFGVVRMTRAVLPHMRAQGQGRIITLGSMAGFSGIPCQSAYVASKFALEGFVESLHYEVSQFNIQVSIIQSGAFKSQIAQKAPIVASPIPVYDFLRSKTAGLLEQVVTEKGKDPRSVGFLIKRIITAKRPSVRYQAGYDSAFMSRFKRFTPFPVFQKVLRVAYGI